MYRRPADRRRIAAYELLTLAGLYYAVAWIIIPRAMTSGAGVAGLFLSVVASAFYYLYYSPVAVHRDTLAQRGLGPATSGFIRTDNLVAAIRMALPVTGVAALAIVAAALGRNPDLFLDLDWQAFGLKFLFYLFSAFFQDLLFFSFVLLRLGEIMAAGSGALGRFALLSVFSLLFALVHLPNTPLMALSFAFAFVFGHLFCRTPNLAVIIAAHALLGTLLHRIYELNMTAGIFYGAPPHSRYLLRHLIPLLNEIIGNRW